MQRWFVSLLTGVNGDLVHKYPENGIFTRSKATLIKPISLVRVSFSDSHSMAQKKMVKGTIEQSSFKKPVPSVVSRVSISI